MPAEEILRLFFSSSNLDSVADDIHRGWTHVVAETIDEGLSELDGEVLLCLLAAEDCEVEDLPDKLALVVIEWIEGKTLTCVCGKCFVDDDRWHEHYMECGEAAREEFYESSRSRRTSWASICYNNEEAAVRY
jgi:hypothetical protein